LFVCIAATNQPDTPLLFNYLNTRSSYNSDLIKELKRMEQYTLSIPINTDEKGYIDKQCPAENCEFIFKVNETDWRDIFQYEAVWCPLCGYDAPADQWFTIEQAEHWKKEAIAIIEGKIHNALKSDADKFNRRQLKGGFITMSMEVKGGRQRTYLLPAPAAEAMQLEIQCEKCNSCFAVIGSAYFCPACGYNSVTRTFLDSIRKIRAKKDSVQFIKESIAEQSGKDEAELTARSLLESCILEGVTAFQKYCEGVYEKYGKAPKNAFQRLAQGSQLWKDTIGKGYSDWLDDNELAELNILFQKRHLLAHNEGIVDEDYLKKSHDTSYRLNQRIAISEHDIKKLLIYLEKLYEGLKAGTV
jgi:predicted RNA-binding Zn-ribbon protein involved in translation (DUF1610 family)